MNVILEDFKCHIQCDTVHNLHAVKKKGKVIKVEESDKDKLNEKWMKSLSDLFIFD